MKKHLYLPGCPRGYYMAYCGRRHVKKRLKGDLCRNCERSRARKTVPVA